MHLVLKWARTVLVVRHKRVTVHLGDFDVTFAWLLKMIPPMIGWCSNQPFLHPRWGGCTLLMLSLPGSLRLQNENMAIFSTFCTFSWQPWGLRWTWYWKLAALKKRTSQHFQHNLPSVPRLGGLKACLQSSQEWNCWIGALPHKSCSRTLSLIVQRCVWCIKNQSMGPGGIWKDPAVSCLWNSVPQRSIAFCSTRQEGYYRISEVPWRHCVELLSTASADQFDLPLRVTS